MGFFDSIKRKLNGKDNAPDSEEIVADQAARDPDVQQVTEEHAQQVGVPKADESQQPLSDEQVKNQEKMQESSGSGDSGESGESSDKTENKSPSLVVKPYEKGKEESDEELDYDIVEVYPDPNAQSKEEEEESEDLDFDIVEVEGPDVQKDEEKEEEKDEDDNFLSRIALGLEDENDDKVKLNAFNRARNALGLYSYSKEEREKIGRQYSRNVSKDERAWQSALHSARYKDSSGKAPNLFKKDALDKVQIGLDVTSGLSSVASSGVGMLKQDSFLGKKAGIGKDTSDKLGVTSAHLSLGSDLTSLASGGISIYKDIQEMKENDKFTTDSEKTKQRLSLASNIVGIGKTVASMGSSASELRGKETAATGHGLASNALGAIGDTLDMAKTGITLRESNKSMGKLEAAMKDDSSSEEFKKLAGVAMQAHKLQKTSAGFEMAKSSASLIGNLTGSAKKIADLAGVKEDSTLGQIVKWADTAGSVISGIGSGLGLVGKAVNWFQKRSRKESDIDAFIDTPNLKNKINSETNYKLNDKQTRKVAKTVLGYKTSDEMYSAILLNYSATIRANAESGSEKDKYRMLIEGLGFKLQGNSDLPPVEAIAKKLSAAS